MDDFCLSPYATKLDVISKKQYFEKLELSESCRFPDPYSINKSLWIKDPSLWPPVEFGDIYVYLMSSGENEFDQQTLKKYKSLSAYEYVAAGASPDGISECDCCGEGIVEIKCPYKHRDKRIEEMKDNKLFCLSNAGTLKENHAYFYQFRVKWQ